MSAVPFELDEPTSTHGHKYMHQGEECKACQEVELFHVIESVIVDRFKVSIVGLSDAVTDAVLSHLAAACPA